MNILVACEESQAVTKELRRRGHRAFSCDLQESSGGHPEWHINGDCLPLLNGRCEFTLENGDIDRQTDRWDMIIAFPPCTHLAVSGARHFEKKRADGRQREGLEFFCKFFDIDCDKVVIENPVNIVSGEYVKRWFPDIAERYGLPRKPTQHIQPYEYGNHSRKNTCLWIKGLPELKPTNIVEPNLVTYTRHNGKKTTFSADLANASGKVRSKTYSGVANAMADQWTTSDSGYRQMDIFDYIH